MGRVQCIRVLLLLGAAAVAAAGAQPFASGLNDGSRLATVESIVDRGTLAIDDSIFVRPSLADPEGGSPYSPPLPDGTFDKVLIGGHFYSDKPAVPAVGMAVIYAVLQRATGLSAQRSVGRFCYWMTVISSGVSFVATMAALFSMAMAVLGTPGRAAAVALAFTVGTSALVYSRAVNIHIVLLALSAWIVVIWLRLLAIDIGRRRRLIVLGALAGAAYACDMGVGPLFALGSIVVIGTMSHWVEALTLFAAGCAPFVLLTHALNYYVGGTVLPIGTVPAFFAYEGSAFGPSDLTGNWNHASVESFALYGLKLVVGRRGFLWFNLPLIFVIPGVVMSSRRTLERPAVWASTLVILATWAQYSALSTNFAGASASIRWFVPLIAPACLIVCLLLRDRLALLTPFLLVSTAGVVIGVLLWPHGPWAIEDVPLLRLWVVLGVGSSVVWSALALAMRGRASVQGTLGV